MSEEDYQRGRRGGDYRIGGDWDDWKAGRDDLERENREAERRWERELDDEIANAQANIAASQPRLYSFSQLVRAIKVAGHKIVNETSDSLFYLVLIDGKSRQVIASDVNDYVYFVIRTRFQCDSEAEFTRDLLYRALRASDRWYETYFAITHSKVKDSQGRDATKWVLSACNDKWKGILNDEWLTGIHTNLFGMCADLESA